MITDEEIWKRYSKAFEPIVMDLPCEYEKTCQDGGIAGIRKLAKEIGSTQLFNAVWKRIKKNDGAAWEMIWLVCAGIAECHPYLLEYFESEDFDIRCDAAIALAHLHHVPAFDYIEDMLANYVPPPREESARELFSCYQLDKIDHPRVLAIVAKYWDKY